MYMYTQTVYIHYVGQGGTRKEGTADNSSRIMGNVNVTYRVLADYVTAVGFDGESALAETKEWLAKTMTVREERVEHHMHHQYQHNIIVTIQHEGCNKYCVLHSNKYYILCPKQTAAVRTAAV